MSPDHHQGFAKHDLGLCRSIHADSVGRPGQRHFRLVADTERGTALLWLEKEQLYDLAVAIKQTMDRAVRDSLAAPPEQRSDVTADYDFKVGRMALGRDQQGETYLLMADLAGDNDDEDDEDDNERDIDNAAPDVALRVSDDLLDRLADEAFAVCSAGRPRCPLCGAPMSDDEAHVCSRSNGHHHL